MIRILSISTLLWTTQLLALTIPDIQTVDHHPAVSELLKVRPRSRLKEHHTHLFHPQRSLFDDLGLAVCHSGVVHRKEFLETYAAATVIHARFSNMTQMADLAAGHGLLGCQGTGGLAVLSFSR